LVDALSFLGLSLLHIDEPIPAALYTHHNDFEFPFHNKTG